MALSNAERQRRFVQRLKAGTVTNERIRELEAEVAKLKATIRRLRNKPTRNRYQPPKRCRTPQAQWKWSLNNFAVDAVWMPDYWTKVFGDDWRKFKVTPEMVNAELAWKSWIEIAVQLKARADESGEPKDPSNPVIRKLLGGGEVPNF
jgi:hypothetical protein